MSLQGPGSRAKGSRVVKIFLHPESAAAEQRNEARTQNCGPDDELSLGLVPVAVKICRYLKDAPEPDLVPQRCRIQIAGFETHPDADEGGSGL